MSKDLSIHLPKTKFPMKGNLPQTEPILIEKWRKNQIYEKMNNQKDKPLFVLIDGPPYANGRIHLGTTLNKILKDILVKQANMSGKNCPFIPVWDCHGLPIELRALKKTKSRIPSEVRKACRKEALHWVKIQEKQFQRLGVLADWDHKVLTMHSYYEAEEVRTISTLIDKKLLYRGKRPIHWCTKLQTAIASSEVEYQNHKSPSVDVKFEITQSNLFPKKSFFIIWTTTPWTLPANQAICLHPEFQYGLYETNQQEYFIIASQLKNSFEKRTGITLTLKKSFKGSELENTPYQHPFLNQVSKIILGNHVTLDAGTGCVHTSPGHGVDDFIVGKKYKLPVFCPVDKAGKFTKEFKMLEGMHVFRANPVIIEKLQKTSHLVYQEEIEHSYPYNPRSKSPLIFRVTDQWFLKFDQTDLPIRKTALERIEKEIQFIPTWNKQRLVSMIQESPDWCLSRQRIWGVPIPILYCEACSHPWINTSFIHHLADQMESSQQGIEYYFEKSEKELLPANAVCEKCQHTHFKKGTDILDVWFDSGICHRIFQKIKGESFFPAHVYLEGSDQHRGWFQTSLNSSIAIHQKSPFKTLVTHGFVYDLEKRKMSKSLGNIIDPEDIVKKYGAEILRLWVAGCDYSQDVSSGEEILNRVRETYRRFRNTIRFLLGNLNDFEPENHQVSLPQMKLIDQWILSQFSEVSDDIQSSYQNFQFHKAYQSLNHFFTTYLSALYLDVIKDRLYTFPADSLERRSAQSALYLLLTHLLRLMAPMTSFLSEEAYSFLPKKNKKESIFLTSFEKLKWNNSLLDTKFKILLKLRSQVTKEIETLRKNQVIGSSLEAKVELTLPKSIYSILIDYQELDELFIVSKVTVQLGSDLQIKITKMKGSKCIRCWYYQEEPLNSDQLCNKCIHHTK